MPLCVLLRSAHNHVLPVCRDLGDNKLTGTMPEGLWSLTKLQYLSLQGNELHGSISQRIGSLQELTRL